MNRYPATLPRSRNHATLRECEAALELTFELADWFEVQFAVYNATDGGVLFEPQNGNFCTNAVDPEVIRAVAASGGPQFLVEADGVCLYGIPTALFEYRNVVCVAPFVLQRSDNASISEKAVAILGGCKSDVRRWAAAARIWDGALLERLGNAVTQKFAAEKKNQRLHTEVASVSNSLSNTFEEISLLYAVIQNLNISSSDEELAEMAIEWLMQCLPAQGIAVHWLPIEETGDTRAHVRPEAKLTHVGEFPLDCAQSSELVAALSFDSSGAPFVANQLSAIPPVAANNGVRQMIVAPFLANEKLAGWLLAVNHRRQFEFGTQEAGLLHSLGGILGIHSGNHDLYRQQEDLLASAVHALSAAIDAKDPYTCGHSDRVARVAVRLAKHLGCDAETLQTLYMAGLLHDVGKIGVSDEVLRKPDRLTDAEYEHIKTHPELGYRILKDIKQFEPCLPVVLHHHEQWDGGGYPHGLANTDTPYLARITAVADAFDAMSSDRPYRKGMPRDKVESILREGAGGHWDPAVVDAFFAVSDDIWSISRTLRANLSLKLDQWA